MSDADFHLPMTCEVHGSQEFWRLHKPDIRAGVDTGKRIYGNLFACPVCMNLIYSDTDVRFKGAYEIYEITKLKAKERLSIPA